ncbi:IS630 family transposase [Thermotalea metallivorans]|uniref:Tc1-like transposase DDE domain-containing protein n=1 Tax=Thermotalea metallivorans TaxID=520762 RepID=A0A140KZ77_9FIRM|nr:IS630 family transposase [Thermotalea metallivorans]KXG73602.1 hypothetical protein AN619_30700 [Thermotalea metallivorans]
MSTFLDIIENLSDVSLWAMDETGKRLESDNYYSWSPIGQPTLIERNGAKKGVNIIGATEVLKHFDFVYDQYINDENHDGSIGSIKVIQFLEKLLDYDAQRGISKTIVILDNAGFHRAKAVQKFVREYEERLTLIFLPVYSPELNPQENIWNWMKKFMAAASAFTIIEEISNKVKEFQTYIRENTTKVKQLVFARNYYK